MTEIENSIYQVIVSNNGIRGADIAEILNIEKKQVNSILYNSKPLTALVAQDANSYKWYVREEKKSSETDNPQYDKDLWNICNYYLNCLSLESSSSVSQFVQDKFAPHYIVLNGLYVSAEENREIIPFLNRINSNKDKKTYLGYPIRIFTVYGKEGVPYKKVAPVFLFPIEYSNGQIDITWTPSINMEVIRGYCGNSTDSLAVELVNLETDLGLNNPDSVFETDEIVLRLKQLRQWDWAEPIDPYDIPSACDIQKFENGIYNRPILIEAESEKYTQGLESELMALANMTEEEYQGTALYSWIKNKPIKTFSLDAKPLLEVLPLNMEQAQAVETALYSDLTIVTGPPGTGKSQVVTDLLVNIAWNKKTALFSSKNNKAVDVVDLRVNNLSRRPILLRTGGSAYAFRLAEIIEGLLTSMPNTDVKSELEYYTNEYNKLLSEEKNLKNRKNSIISLRNNLDELEQDYCSVRSTVDKYLSQLDISDSTEIQTATDNYYAAWYASIKKNNNFFARLFWNSVKHNRYSILEKMATEYNIYAEKYELPHAYEYISLEEMDNLKEKATAFADAIVITDKYKKALYNYRNVETTEAIDKKLSSNKDLQSNIASKLWDKWLSSQSITFTSSERQEMSDYVTEIKLAQGTNISQDPNLQQQYTRMSKKITEYLQCWAVTSLSAKSKIPFTAGMFDYLIIDEASQCDIASIIPLLFRAKKVIIIGDPKQLSHISQLTRQQDRMLLRQYNISPSWSYSVNSLYALASTKVNPDSLIHLRDHFRCCSDIIEFSNSVFYEGRLRSATKHNQLKTPAGEKPGIRWINIQGNTVRPNTGSAFNTKEASAVIDELKRLVNSGYKGSIGVTTPFKKQAEEINSILQKNYSILYEQLINNHAFIADTVHKFQGDERDIMIFSPVISSNAPSTSLDFLKSTGNLFNVAITRARAILIVVGNLNYCKTCTVDYLRQFANYYEKLNNKTKVGTEANSNTATRDYPPVKNPEQVSEWEKIFYTALYDEGIITYPQYPDDKYILDLALILDNNRKLDIEIDGEMYHRKWNGELCYRDQLRNQRLIELGWDVKRFWVCQIRDDRQWCVNQIQDWINNNK